MKEKLVTILKEAEKEIAVVQTYHELNNLKSRYIGKKSEIKEFMKHLGSLPPQERPSFGKEVNEALVYVETLLEQATQRLKEREYEKAVQSSRMDYSMPGRPLQRGGKHPLSIVQEQIEDVMLSLGFQVAEGFDVEDEYHNFDALNTPKNHPSRNLADTFYIIKGEHLKKDSRFAKEEIVLRTHTSPVQIRVLEKYPPPIKIISPGRAYRNDKFDPTHSPVFHQWEGLVVGENISFKDLKDTLDFFIKKMFGASCVSRFRPHFFPFTEPSAEIDVSCFVCHGKGCSTCKNSGWIEIAGAGMVHPNIFDMLKIDSEKYTGFAFGMGIDRIAMLKYHIPDIRMFFENDLRFLKQFS